MNIRALCPWEEEEMLPLAEQFCLEAQKLMGTTSAFNRDECLRNWRSLPQRVLLGAFKQSELIGVLAGFMAPQFMTGDLVAQEMFWYMKPEHRRGTLGAKLFLEFEKWATRNAARGIVMAALDKGSDVAKLYQRKGYALLEIHYLKPL